MKRLHLITASLGISAVALFCFLLAVFSFLHPGFSQVDDYVSQLGAHGQPYSLWWNLLGFLSVGVLLMAFGLAYGRILQDRLIGILLAIHGIGFAATAIPTDLRDANLAMSKAHTVAICFSLAAWLLGLARMASLPTLRKEVQSIANIAAGLMVLPILGLGAGLWTMPVTHRLVFAVVFGWIVVTSWQLLSGERTLRPMHHTDSARSVPVPSSHESFE